ncbi:MAG: hypothetical protein Q8P18_19295 [Pseudomonadota bacterium]|nr:hypothetical protein [Pseudomonadota bacterium]
MGGPCPTFDEAKALTCDGHRFAASGGGTAARWSEREEDDCPPIVSCDEGLLFTRLWFASNGDGEIGWISVNWPEDDECPGYYVFGQAWC